MTDAIVVVPMTLLSICTDDLSNCTRDLLVVDKRTLYTVLHMRLTISSSSLKGPTHPEEAVENLSRKRVLQNSEKMTCITLLTLQLSCCFRFHYDENFASNPQVKTENWPLAHQLPTFDPCFFAPWLLVTPFAYFPSLELVKTIYMFKSPNLHTYHL